VRQGIPKPYDTGELLARIHVVSQRSVHEDAAAGGENELRLGSSSAGSKSSVRCGLASELPGEENPQIGISAATRDFVSYLTGAHLTMSLPSA
jgi:hypothetical protein